MGLERLHAGEPALAGRAEHGGHPVLEQVVHVQTLLRHELLVTHGAVEGLPVNLLLVAVLLRLGVELLLAKLARVGGLGSRLSITGQAGLLVAFFLLQETGPGKK